MEASSRLRWAISVSVAVLGVMSGSGNAQISARWLTGGVHFQMASANIFSDTADAKAQIRTAILQAGYEHKHVLLDFGGNWCEDCQLLNIYFHDPGNASLLAANYVQVDVNVGEYDKNLDVVRRYGIPLNKGVPALAVLDGSGKILYAQKNAEFEKIHTLDSAAVTTFLQKWRPKAVHPKPIHAKAGSRKAGD